MHNYIPTCLTLLLFFFIQTTAYGQCEVTASAVPNDITCGTCVTLTAFGEGQGTSVFTESFNSGAPTGWQSTASATYTNPCNTTGVNGTTHLWMGDATGVPRQMTTIGFDFTTATSGATICFDMLFAEQGDASPCEGPDEPDEGVYVQYSIDNGATWVTIHYFDPNGGNDASLINWNNWCFPLPAGAITANTQIRWFQDNDSGAEYDHWGIDNVNIYFNDPTYSITWAHDGYTYGVGNGGGDNPTQVCPSVTTTYVVNMTNGTATCTDNVTITVSPPVFRVDAGLDTTICAGQCLTLAAEATVVVSPSKTPTYENSEISALAGLPSASDLVNILLPCTNFSGCTCPDGSSVPFLGTCPAIFNGSLSMNINITDLNTTSLSTGELTSVCIGDALMVVGDLSPFAITLDCPSGNSITLANAGDVTGTLLNNTCFDLTSTTLLSAGSSPYSGNFQPVDPLTNLNGCSGNGVWTLTFTGTFDLSSGTLPVGFLNGWEISFNDPEISYTGLYSWSPTTNMTNSNTLTPTVCPIATTNYVLTVTDSANCATAIDDVTINVTNANCCPFDISYTATNPSCGSADGAIDVTINNGSGNYGFAWVGGQVTEDLTSLTSGVYMLTVTDSTLNCSKDTSITLTAANAPVIDSLFVEDSTSCGSNNGSIEIFASGGAPPLEYSIDNGVTFVPGNLFTNLAAGNYPIIVSDSANCTTSANVVINPSFMVVIDSLVVEHTICGLSNGLINVFASGGNSGLLYSIDNGVTFQVSNQFSPLTSGMYQIVVQDSTTCSANTTQSIDSSNSVAIDSLILTDPGCGLSDGTIEVASTSASPLNYSIDMGASYQTSPIFTGLTSGLYSIWVQGPNNCLDSLDVTLSSANAPVIDTVIVTDVSCLNNDGSITINASGGQAPLSYSIDNGVSFQPGNAFNNIAGGSYTVVVSDDLSCTTTQSVTIQTSSSPQIDSLTLVDESCGSLNGSITIFASQGTAPLSYSIDSGLTLQSSNTFSGLASGSYNIWVEDDNGCSITQTAVLSNNSGPTIDQLLLTNTTCGISNGIIEILASGGSSILEYSIDNGATFQTSPIFDLLTDGNYTVVVRETNNFLCFVDSLVTVNPSTGLVLDSINFFNESCAGMNDGVIDIYVSGGLAPLAFTVNNVSSGSSLNDLVPGNYLIEIEDANNCSITDNVVIDAGPAVSITTIDDTSIILGTEIQLTSIVSGSSSGMTVWSPVEGLSCSDCLSPIVNIENEAYYTVNYTDVLSNCTAEDNVLISILPTVPYCAFPSGFSPNDDGVNDYFQAICNNIAFVDLSIYNKWGELVFHQKGDQGVQWDGTYKTKQLGVGVYIFKAAITYEDETEEDISGNVSLIR